MKVIKGDITDLNLLYDYGIGAIVHGCNIRGIMGSGLAKTIKEKFPVAYEADKTFPLIAEQRYGKFSCATFSYVTKYNTFIEHLKIGNLYQQDLDDVTPRLKLHYLLEALESFIKEYPEKILGIPYKIGCGLAGGNWEEVRTAIENVVNRNGVKAYWVDFN
jgi:O-acetyl-ADP-ribose deacetylase (regulator of RNase III)